MKQAQEPPPSGDRSASRAPRLVVSFVDRNWLWSRAGLALSLFLAVPIAAFTLTPIPPGPPMLVGLDKVYHFLAFAVLVFPVIVTDTRRWAWVVPLAIVYGGLIELVQPYVGRSAEWLDFGANVSGVLAGAALAEILHNRLRASVLGPEPDLGTMLPLVSEADRLDRMRAELMSDLRTVLREELGNAGQNAGASAADAGREVPENRAENPTAEAFARELRSSEPLSKPEDERRAS